MVVADIEDTCKDVDAIFSSPFAGNGSSNDSSDIENFRSSILCWYDANRRKLPWRGDDADIDASPYGTWVSEIMLQQTRVDTVISYFRKWMVKFPTVEALANGTPDEVNSLWAGLGYYRRARFLHKGAKYVVEECGGEVPGDVKSLLRIPGIGPYTAGAVSSIAFNQPETLVDGNVIRVFARLAKSEKHAKDPKLIKACWALARRILDNERPGDFNQSLMELGATVCKPKLPQCQECPVQSHCCAYAAGPENVTLYPRAPPKKVVPEYNVAICCVMRSVDGKDEYLMKRRPNSGLLAGQWEFVACMMGVATASDHPSYQERKQVVDVILGNALLEAVLSRRDAGKFTHKFSHQHHHMFIEDMRVASTCTDTPPLPSSSPADNLDPEWAWMSLERMNTVGVTKSAKRIIAIVSAPPKTKAKRNKKKRGNAKRKRNAPIKGQTLMESFVGRKAPSTSGRRGPVIVIE